MDKQQLQTEWDRSILMTAHNLLQGDFVWATERFLKGYQRKPDFDTMRELIRNYIMRIANKMHVDISNIVYVFMTDDMRGAYGHDKRNIMLNIRELENDSGEEIVSIILHELRHAEQQQNIKYSNTELGRAMLDESRNYTLPSGGIRNQVGYMSNLLERDAQRFSYVVGLELAERLNLEASEKMKVTKCFQTIKEGCDKQEFLSNQFDQLNESLSNGMGATLADIYSLAFMENLPATEEQKLALIKQCFSSFSTKVELGNDIRSLCASEQMFNTILRRLFARFSVTQIERHMNTPIVQEILALEKSAYNSQSKEIKNQSNIANYNSIVEEIENRFAAMDSVISDFSLPLDSTNRGRRLRQFVDFVPELACIMFEKSAKHNLTPQEANACKVIKSMINCGIIDKTIYGRIIISKLGIEKINSVYESNKRLLKEHGVDKSYHDAYDTVLISEAEFENLAKRKNSIKNDLSYSKVER